MPPRFRGPLLCLLLVLPLLLPAQTADKARLIFTVGVGQTTGGGNIWQFDHAPFDLPDSAGQAQNEIAISRSFKRTLNLLFAATYFPGEHVGVSVEAQLLGLASEDRCAVALDSTTVGPSRQTLHAACRDLDGRSRSGGAVALSVGGIYRIFSSQAIHPYIRANAGLLLTEQSFIKTEANLDDGSTFLIFGDPHPESIRPYYAFGGGIVAVVGRGYQLRFEVRDNFVRIPTVAQAAGPPGYGLVNATTKMINKQLITFNIGFDIVLERKRGRRY